MNVFRLTLNMSLNMREAFLQLHSFFKKSNTFISNARLKLAKNQAKAKKYPEAELLTYENY